MRYLIMSGKCRDMSRHLIYFFQANVIFRCRDIYGRGKVRFGVMGLTCESDLDSSQGPTRSPEMYGTQFTTSYDRTRAHNSVRRFHGPRRSYIAVGEQRGAQKHAPMRAAPLLNGPAAPHGRPSQPPTQKHASIGRIRSLRATPGPPRRRSRVQL